MKRGVCSPSLFSPQFWFKSGTSNSFTRNPLHNLSNFRCFTTNLVSNGKRSGEPRFEFDNVNGPDDALILYRTMINTTPFSDVKLFNCLLSRTVKIKEYPVAAYLFNDISKSGKILVNNYTLNIMINCYCNIDRVDLGFSMLCLFFKRGYKPDRFTFSPLLKALFRQRKIAEAKELFRNIEREKLREVNHLSGVMMDGLRKDAMALPLSFQFCFKELLLSNAYELGKMDYYDSIINGLCKDKKLDTARELLDGLPTLHTKTYNAVISKCCEKGLIADAKDILVTMEQKGGFPNEIAYNTIVRGMLERNEFDDANKFLDVMDGKGFSPDMSTIDLVSGLFELDEDNHTLLDMMEKCDLHYWPDFGTDTYKLLMY